MVSRRKILSRSRDELHSDIYYMAEDDDDDVWHSKDKLYRDHLQEVIDKWDSIDDEIWAKIIVLERNRRVAKAYARAPVLTVNGGHDGFDGFRIGVAGFDNPMRDPATDDAIRSIGNGFKLKMDDVGNILIKRISSRGSASGVTIENTTEESAISNDILKLPNGMLEVDKPFKVFDMKKFQQNMNRELKRPFPDRHKLESQCISAISFGASKNSMNNDNSNGNVLNVPIWLMAVNIVAMEMLRTKLPPLPSTPRYRTQSGPVSIMNGNSQPMIRPFGSGSSDEDPYSVAGSGSSGGSSGNGGVRVSTNPVAKQSDRPPKLPPRDTPMPKAKIRDIYGPSLWARPAVPALANLKKTPKKSSGDDPYYCGLRARIPNFVKSRKKKLEEKAKKETQSKESQILPGKELHPPQPGQQRILPAPTLNSMGGVHGGVTSTNPLWWHSRLYSDLGHLGSLGTDPSSSSSNYQRNPVTSMMPYITDSSDSDYSHIYGRLPIPTRSGVRRFSAKPLFLSNWE